MARSRNIASGFIAVLLAHATACYATVLFSWALEAIGPVWGPHFWIDNARQFLAAPYVVPAQIFEIFGMMMFGYPVTTVALAIALYVLSFVVSLRVAVWVVQLLIPKDPRGFPIDPPQA